MAAEVLWDMAGVECVAFGQAGRPDARGLMVCLQRFRARPGSCFLSVTPLAVARQVDEGSSPEEVPCPGGYAVWALEPPAVRPFTLAVKQGKACFDRHLRLPRPLRGLGLGTYFLTWLVGRAVDIGLGAARVRSLHLVGRDHCGLRTGFYRGMGFRVVLWPDGTGWARAARLDVLRRIPDQDKIRVMVPGLAPDTGQRGGELPASC